MVLRESSQMELEIDGVRIFTPEHTNQAYQKIFTSDIWGEQLHTVEIGHAYPGHINAWMFSLKHYNIFNVIAGGMFFGLWDLRGAELSRRFCSWPKDRYDSRTAGVGGYYLLNQFSKCTIVVPPSVAFGFMGIGGADETTFLRMSNGNSEELFDYHIVPKDGIGSPVNWLELKQNYEKPV